MLKIILFCKSYISDLKRFQRFWDSLYIHNVEKIPFYVCVPKSDLKEFKEKITNSDLINWLTDEQIVDISPGGNIKKYKKLNPALTQQIIKAEVWRKLNVENYVCFDSDSVIIRDIFVSDFLSPNGIPFTVMHQHKLFWELSLKRSDKHLRAYLNLSKKIKDFFGRSGPDFDYGPSPCIWSRAVWLDLYEKTLRPSNKNLWDAINEIPSEILWYGETILEHKSIPLIPIDPLMKAYLYQWQLKNTYRVSKEMLAKIYIGVVYQSNWEHEFNYGEKKRITSILLRKLKRFLAKI